MHYCILHPSFKIKVFIFIKKKKMFESMDVNVKCCCSA